MNKTFLISQSISLTLLIFISLIFVFLGIYYSKKYQGLNSYLTANRNIGLFSLTTSLIASALGAWVLFGPALKLPWTKLKAPKLSKKLSYRVIVGTSKQAKGKSVEKISNIRDQYLVDLQKLRKKYEKLIRN